MVVVILVGILAVMAIPAMGDARIDQHAFNDTTLVADLVREARVHAIGRGAATLVTLSANGSDKGTFTMKEAVGLNPLGTGVGSAPRSTCRAPTIWTNTTGSAATDVWAKQVRQVAFGTYETRYGIGVRVFEDNTGTPVVKNQVHICFTPLGRSYMVTSTTPVFDSAPPMTGVVQVEVARVVNGSLEGFARRILIPPSGAARVLSATEVLP